MEGAGEILRIRLLFEDMIMLNRKQRLEGLNQCWMIVKPHLKTVEEIATDISFTFHLHRSCPHGVVLTMDGFTLPSSQPTYILKDKDIVSVHKKRDAFGKEILTNEEVSIRNSETIGEKLSGLGGVKLLAPDEFEKEAGGYQSEHEDNETNSKDDTVSHFDKPVALKELSCKKRKQSELLWCSKGKHVVANDHGSSLQVVAEVGDDKHIRKKNKKRRTCKERRSDAIEDQNHSKAHEGKIKDAKNVGGMCSKEEISWKVKDKRTKRTKAKKESDELQLIDRVAERYTKSFREHDGVEVITPATENTSMPAQVEKKSPSRSAKRKKAKRRWLREQKAANHELNQSNGIVHNQLLTTNEKLKKSNQDDDVEAEEESLPVVVRPGHIRFLPLDEDYDSQEIQNSVPVLHWNGITTKRQGQNWGKEKICVKKVKEQGCPKETTNSSSPDRQEEASKEHEEAMNILSNNGDETSSKHPLNFDELSIMSGLPQEGDVIAYRLVELSVSSWCPELSSFRVGKVASYDCQSTKIRLEPVSEYPLVVNVSLGEEHAEETDISPYNEDGSLELDFGSLIDVRWVQKRNYGTNTTTDVMDAKGSETLAICANGERNSKSSDSMNTGFPVANEPITATNVNGDGENRSAWDEISQAFNSKKIELSLKEKQSKKMSMDDKTRKSSRKSRTIFLQETTHISKQENGSTTPRSFKALRSSALGPTMSFLRSQNVL